MIKLFPPKLRLWQIFIRKGCFCCFTTTKIR